MFTFILFCLYFKNTHLIIIFLEFILLGDYILLVLDADLKRRGIQPLSTYNKILKYLSARRILVAVAKHYFCGKEWGCTAYRKYWKYFKSFHWFYNFAASLAYSSLYYNLNYICGNVYSCICFLSELSTMEACEQGTSWAIFFIFY